MEYTLYDDEAEYLNWKLKTVLPDGELHEECCTLETLLKQGFKVVYETSEVMFLSNPYTNWVDAFILDKGE